MRYLSAEETASHWGVSVRYVQRMASEGRVFGARRVSRAWLIPDDAPRPCDRRRAERASIPPTNTLPRCMPLLAMTDIYSAPGHIDEALPNECEYPVARALMEAEIAYLQGRMKDAFTRSRALLPRADCLFSRLGCLLLSQIAGMYTGDHTQWTAIGKEIDAVPARTPEEQAVKQLVQTLSDSIFLDDRRCPDWLRFGRFDALPRDCLPVALAVYAKAVLLRPVSRATVRYLEPLCAQRRMDNVPLSELYLRLYIAAGYRDCGDTDNALYHLDRALDIALPDGLITPLAETRRNIGALLDERLSLRDPDACRATVSLYNSLTPAWTRLYQRRLNRHLSGELSLREIEVLRFAAAGYTNARIAQLLHVSDGTVKNYISSVLRKTGLRSRAGFRGYLWG